MPRKMAALAIAAALGLLLFPLSAAAHVSTAPTSLTIKKVPGPPIDRGDRVLVFGKLKSPDADCRVNQQVVLFRKRPGPDKRLRADRTDAEGEYRFRLRPNRTLKLYTRFQGSVDTSYEHSHSCEPSKSKNKKVKVRR